MYLTKLVVNKFGALRSGTYTFTDGLNIIRAANGTGKSTMIEAVLYAMFGTSSLRGSLDDAVTEGVPVADLKVEVTYGPYKVSRSKSSASLEGHGVKLSGQANVSDFFYDLLGISKGTESSVLVSEQGDTAGIVSGKSSEITELIETLAGFDQIDKLLERVKEKFPSGNQTLLEELLSVAKAELSEKENKPEEDKSKYDNTALMQQLQEADLRLKSVDEKLNGVRIELAQAEGLKANLRNLTGRHEAIVDTVRHKEDYLKVLTSKSKESVEDTSVEEAYLASFTEMQAQYNLYKAVTAFVQPETTWDGDLESFEAEFQSVSDYIATLQDHRGRLSASIDHHKSLINDDKTCPMCKQDVSHLHVELNETARVKVAELTSEFMKVNLDLKESKDYLNTLTIIKEEQMFRNRFHEYADESVVPWVISWKSDAVVAPSTSEFQRCRAAVQAANNQERLIAQAVESMRVVTRDIEALKVELSEVSVAMKSITIIPTSDLELKVEKFRSDKIAASDFLHALNSKVMANTKELARVEADNLSRSVEIKSLKAKCEEFEERIKADLKNSFIKKEVMKAKPVVLNQVWDSVLVAVSSAFSILRGKESTVLKTVKGFSVNGLPVHRLSGSEKSILGIALRSTLRDIFAPVSNLMIFDEPSADCDSDRTAAVAAALASLRGQVLMITHEDVSDGLANNIVEVA